MRLRWSPGIPTTWRPLAMVLGLLLLLTYLLCQSRTPVPLRDTHFHEALQHITLYDVRLTRDVLEAIRKPCSNVVPVSSSFLAVMKCRVTGLRKPVQHKMYMTNLYHSGT